MSRNYIILEKNNNLLFTGITSSLSLNDNYYSYDQSGLNKGIVTEFNVKQFLNDSSNEKIAIDFFNYLNNNTSSSELYEINNDNKKLSDLFKKYYNTSILLGRESSMSFVDESLIFTSGITINNINYALTAATIVENIMTGTPAMIISSTKRLNDIKEELTTYTIEPSYYIDLLLNFTIGEIAQIKFADFLLDEQIIISGKTVNLKQGFVNLNISTNPNEFWY